MPEVPDHAQLDVFGTGLHVGDQVGDEIVPFPVFEAAIARAGLLVVGSRLAGLIAPQMAFDPLTILVLRPRRLAQATLGAGLVIDVGIAPTAIHLQRHLAIALIGGVGAFGRVDLQLQIVGADPIALGIGIGQRPPLQHLVVGKVDALHQHPGAEGGLFGFGEDIRGIAIQHQPAHLQQGKLVFRPALGVVQGIEGQFVVRLVRHDLHAHLPLGIVTPLDGVVEVATGMAHVVFLDLGRLRAGEIPDALLGLEGELAQHRHALVVDQLVGVHAGTLHVPIVRRDAPGALYPGDHVQRFRVMLDEVVEAPGLLAIGDGVGLEGMDHVGKLDGVANEEHLQVVAHQIPVAVLGIELDREAPRIARGLGRLLGPDDSGKSQEDRRLHPGSGQHLGTGIAAGGFVADGAIGLEPAMGGGTPGMHHPLGHPFPVEMGDLLDELVVFQRGGAPLAHAAQALIVPYRMTLAGRESDLGVAHDGLQASHVEYRGDRTWPRQLSAGRRAVRRRNGARAACADHPGL